MVNLDEITKWVTLAGAVIGGVTGAMTYWSKATEKRDRIKVSFGPLTPPIAPGDSLYVVSQSDHKLQLRDYGFIDKNGRLLSLPDMWANSFGDDGDGSATSGSTSLVTRNDIWEVAYVRLRDEQIGAYAITVSQTMRRLDFHDNLPKYRRFYLRLKIWWAAEWQ